jgi:hypothetical protein
LGGSLSIYENFNQLFNMTVKIIVNEIYIYKN